MAARSATSVFPLVVRLGVAEGLLKLRLPGTVRGKREARRPGPLGVQTRQFSGQLSGGGLGPALGALPLSAAHPGQADRVLFPSADILGHQVQLRGRDVQTVRAGVADLDVILFRPVHGDFEYAGEPADPVVLVHHQISHREVGAGADALGVGHGAAAFAAAQGTGHDLRIRKHGEPDLRHLQSRGKASHRHGTAAEGRQFSVGVAVQGSQSVFLQHGAQNGGSPFVGGKDDHAVLLIQEPPDILQRRLQASAVGRQLPRLAGERAAGRYGVASRGKRVGHHQGKLGEPLRHILPGKEIGLGLLYGDRRAGQQAHILAQLVEQLSRTLGAAAGGIQNDQSVRRQVVQRRYIVFINIGKIPVRPGKRRPLADPLGVPPEPGGRLLSAGAAGKGAGPSLQRPSQSRPVHGIDLVAPELRAYGAVRSGRKNVKNAAPAGELARALHHVAAAVSAREQPGLQRLGPVPFADRQRKGRIGEHIGGKRALREPRGGEYAHPRAGGDGVKSAQPLLLALTGDDLRVPEHRVTGCQHRDLLSQQSPKVRRKGGRGGIVGTDHRDRAGTAFSQQSRCHRAHRAGRLRDQGRQIALLDPQGEGVQGG